MILFDIHSHILPYIDDGARNTEAAVAILEAMRNQGITDVIATPHFIATEENLEEFISKVNTSLEFVRKAVLNRNVPNIHIGSEVFYFNDIGKSESIRELCLCKSNFLLLELPNCAISNTILSNIINLYENLGITPIIAHIERYYKEKNFKSLLNLISDGVALAQTNAASLIEPYYKRKVLKLIKKGYISFIATDAHSITGRPPLLDKALNEISLKLGDNIKNILIKNSEDFYNTIIGDSFNA